MRAPSILALAVVAFAALATAQHCLPNDDCWPATATIYNLASSLSEGAEMWLPYGPSGDLYEHYAQDTPGNALMPSSPGIIFKPSTEADVKKIVTFAAKYKIRVVGKCSGHDQLQRSNGYGVIQLIMTNFKDISYDNATHAITFGAGNAHKDTYAFLAERGRFAIGGTWAYVCPAGCLSNGCYGFFTKEFGTGADNILALRFMLFNGTVLHLDETGPHKDLFWAVLGGGASSYGVLLEITAKTYEAPAFFLIVNIDLYPWPGNSSRVDGVPSVFERFLTNLTWYEALPAYISWELKHQPSDGKVGLIVSYTGRKSAAEAQAELQALIAEFAEAGYYMGHAVTPYSDVADYAVQNSGPAPPIRRISQSYYVDANQTALDKVAVLWEEIYDPGLPNPASDPSRDGMFFFWAQYRYGPGSRAGKAPHVAAGMRTAMMEIAHENVWLMQADDLDRAPVSDVVKSKMEALGTSGYQNHCSSWAGYNTYDDKYKTFFYQDWDKLMQTKRKYDPCNLYVVQYGPGWDAPKATCGLDGPKRPSPRRPPPRRKLIA